MGRGLNAKNSRGHQYNLIYFLTYNDPPTGVYKSQVAGVCAYLRDSHQIDVKLVALISIRSFWANRRKIRTMYPNAMVLPMFPKHRNWRKNRILLQLFVGNKSGSTIICRGIFSNKLARTSGQYKSVVFDGRGAYAAEFREYLGREHVTDDVADLEREAVHESDICLAVSNALVDHWKKEYNYENDNHVIVPCTLNETEFSLHEEKIRASRKKYGFTDQDVVYIYSGSIAGWQSGKMMDEYCFQVLAANTNAHFVFLSKFDLTQFESYNRFEDRIKQFWVSPEEVRNLLLCGDYGILIREQSITNKVASPTKFAEYLLAGLKVIISPNLGDYSDLVKEENLGEIFKEEKGTLIHDKLTFEEKKKLNRFAIDNFTKSVFKNEYRKIIRPNE